ncbi:MAG: 16S rRNA (cytidine(1402)-2'-O)-methyltransferase [Gammaproteobacteria bacterium]|nr:16S rRNA (cytidine(1402)-2'-O)-methyltransferase [Gammaproteobacteria bacterium]
MNPEPSILYVVATPIGNLADISARALEILEQVDVIAAEDTRHSARLLQHYGIQTPTVALHEHNERKVCDKLLQRIADGESLALISDAGTPLLSDPGYHLVREARQRGLRVVPVPGPCALITALSAAGLPTDCFYFGGFLPSKSTARLKRLQGLKEEVCTLVFYESPHRIEETLQDMLDVFGPSREAVLAREITKTFETIHGDTLEALVSWLGADKNQRKGEMVILVHGQEKQTTSEISPEAERIMAILQKELPLKQAASLAAGITGAKKNQLYQQAVKNKNEAGKDSE